LYKFVTIYNSAWMGVFVCAPTNGFPDCISII